MFLLFEVITELSDCHDSRSCALVSPIDFDDQTGDSMASSIRVGIFGNGADHSFSINSLAIRSFVRPPKLPDIGTDGSVKSHFSRPAKRRERKPEKTYGTPAIRPHE